MLLHQYVFTCKTVQTQRGWQDWSRSNTRNNVEFLSFFFKWKTTILLNLNLIFLLENVM